MEVLASLLARDPGALGETGLVFAAGALDIPSSSHTALFAPGGFSAIQIVILIVALLGDIGTWGGGRSTMIDPDGRVLQEAGSNQTFLTEIIDLDHVTRTREYGTLGLAQTLFGLVQVFERGTMLRSNHFDRGGGRHRQR